MFQTRLIHLIIVFLLNFAHPTIFKIVSKTLTSPSLAVFGNHTHQTVKILQNLTHPPCLTNIWNPSHPPGSKYMSNSTNAYTLNLYNHNIQTNIYPPSSHQVQFFFWNCTHPNNYKLDQHKILQVSTTPTFLEPSGSKFRPLSLSKKFLSQVPSSLQKICPHVAHPVVRHIFIHI